MSSGFSFGAKTTASPAFGTGTINFGTPLTQQQPTGFQLGSSTTSATPTLFGTPVPASASSLFGGAQSASLFGAPAQTSTNVSFGTATTSTVPGLSFGVPASSTAPTSGLSFAAPTTTTATLSFGLRTVTHTTSAPSLGLTTGASNAAAAPSFGFGSGTATTSGGGLSFNLAGAPASTAAGGLSFGLGGTSITSGAPSSVTPATNSTSTGLGGIAQAKSGTVTTQKEIPPKDQPLPNEILQTVEAFKEMVKQQKMHSSDISRCSVRDFRRVEQEIDLINSSINEVECQLQKNRQLAEKLKYDTAKSVQNVEMAQRTHDTPPGLQYENTAPLKFFLNLADQFERDMQMLKMQIESADKYVKNYRNPDVLTSQDLAMGMRKLHETFVALAGRLQSVHSQVESQKETYLNIRKHLLNDTNNPFDNMTRIPEFDVQSAFIHSQPKVATGPTPFNNLALGNLNPGSQQHSTPPPAYPGVSTSAPAGFGSSGTFGTSLGTNPASNTSLFGTTFGQSSFNNSSFQLQKPPVGVKRGKM